MAVEVPLVFPPIKYVAGGISDLSPNEIEEISASSSDLIGVPKESSQSDDWEQKEFEARIEPSCPFVRDEAAMLAHRAA
jgi:hypothetical protein